MAPDPPALKLRSCVAPSIRRSCSWAALTVCRYSSTSSSLSSREGLKPGTRLVSEWSHFLWKLAISHSTSEKTCSNAISSTGVRRRPPVPGMNRVSTNSARMIPCHHLKRRLVGVSVIPSHSCLGIVAQWTNPMSQAERCLMLRYDLADLRG